MSDDNFLDVPSDANPREVLIGEGKKYANEDEALKGLLHAQQRIQSLKDEAAAKNTLEEYLAKVDAANAQKTEPVQTPPVVETPPVAEQTAPSGIPEGEGIEDKVLEVLERREREKAATTNFERVQAALVSKFGTQEKANEAVSNRAQELGVSVQFLQDVARKSDKAFLAQMGLDAKPTPTTPSVTPRGVNSSVVTLQNNADAPQEGTQAWYRALQRSDPKRYRSSSVQSKMMNDLEKNPEKFFGRAV